MIARLRGTVVGRAGDATVVDIHGVGYAVHLPASFVAVTDSTVLLHVSTQVREDAITLYGFATPEERETFDLLHSASGVGPRTALAILGHLDLAELRRALADGDIKVLTRVPGVGKKIAERLCLELRDKVPAVFMPVTIRPFGPPDPLPLALAKLEYRKSEIDRALASPEVPPPDAPLEDRLRAALRVLSGPR
jgi:Holliday junction DNA helicase RuvA